MSLSSSITINTHYTRSVNLERDSNSLDVIKAYIPTSRALRTFSRIADTFHDGVAPRAWSFIGPYGSGKSSSSIFLSQLLSCGSDTTTEVAHKILGESSKDLKKSYVKQVKGNNGYLKVLVTGSPEPMGKRIVEGLAAAAEKYWSELKDVRKDRVVKKLQDATENTEIKDSDILKLVKELQEKLQSTGCKGILLVIDEFGKFLEYEARHYGANDIYLLQLLAEHACKGDAVNLMLCVLLHQSFEQYSKGLGENLKNEWSKVQGRFEEVPFLESAEQVLRVVSAAFHRNMKPADEMVIEKHTAAIVGTLFKEDALPGVLNIHEAENLFKSCYPLHPVSALLLPLLCQKVAQNERTLFSYLGSHEEFGFQHVLKSLESVGDFIMPHHIFDYFITNQPAVMGDYLTHRRWAEVVTAIERLGDANDAEVNLLKTVGLLNIIGGRGGLKASKPILKTCFKSVSVFNVASKALAEKSIVNYRKFNSEYRVWQGSDFDIESALQEELNNIGNFALADELNSQAEMLPVVARRYTIENGTLRYFVPIFVDAQTYKRQPVSGEEPRIIFYLASGQDDEKSFRDMVSSYYSALDMTVLCLSGLQLREAVSETLVLKRLRNTSQELNSDPVAKREYEDRLTAAQIAQDKLLQDLVDAPDLCEWWNQGVQKKIANKRTLQVVLSSVLEDVYRSSPIIFNELINRDRPSAQAVAARNKLMYAMLNFEGQKDLGIEKFPAEKAIYRSVLLETGIHSEFELGKWKFSKPTKRKANIIPVWKRIDEFLDSTEKTAKSFAELNDELMAPPYGVKAGLLPIIYMAVYMANRHELAFYQNNRYTPRFDEELLDRFVKRPDEFTIQRFRIAGVNAEIYQQYKKALFKENTTSKEMSVVQLITPLAEFMGGLPKYTLKTQTNLRGATIALRKAFLSSHSPEKLLFEELPMALGFDGATKQEMESFPEALRSAVRELKYAHQSMKELFTKAIAEAFSEKYNDDIKQLRHPLSWLGKLENYTIERDGLKAFLNRISESKGSDEAWLESIMSFLGQLPTEQWTDNTYAEAEYKLVNFSKRIRELQTLYISYEDHKKAGEDVDVYMLKAIKLGGKDRKPEVITIDSDKHEAVQGIKNKLLDTLDEQGVQDTSLKLAALAEFVEEYLDSLNVDNEFKENKNQIGG